MSTHKVRLPYNTPWKTQGIQSPCPHTKSDCLSSHHGKLENTRHSVTTSTHKVSETALQRTMENPGHSVTMSTHKVRLPYNTPWKTQGIQSPCPHTKLVRLLYSEPWKTQGIQSPYPHTTWDCLTSHHGKPRAFSHHIHTQRHNSMQPYRKPSKSLWMRP